MRQSLAHELLGHRPVSRFVHLVPGVFQRQAHQAANVPVVVGHQDDSPRLNRLNPRLSS